MMFVALVAVEEAAVKEKAGQFFCGTTGKKPKEQVPPQCREFKLQDTGVGVCCAHARKQTGNELGSVLFLLLNDTTVSYHRRTIILNFYVIISVTGHYAG